MPTSAGTRTSLPGFMPDEAQHRRRIADWMREIHQGNMPGNVTIPGTLTVSGTLTTAQVAKAWCAFSGVNVVTLRQSFNVTSITDSGVGNYDVNLTTALSASAYCPLASIQLNVPATFINVTPVNASQYNIGTTVEGFSFTDALSVFTAVWSR